MQENKFTAILINLIIVCHCKIVNNDLNDDESRRLRLTITITITQVVLEKIPNVEITMTSDS